MGVWRLHPGAVQGVGRRWRRDWRRRAHILVGVSPSGDGVRGLIRQEDGTLGDVGGGRFQICQQRI